MESETGLSNTELNGQHYKGLQAANAAFAEAKPRG
jgi:hypothetical protein